MVEGASGKGHGWRLRRQLGRAGVVAVLVAVVSVLLVGTAEAAPSAVGLHATSVKWAKPFAGYEGAAISTITSGCRATLGFPAQPFFNMTTGQGTGSTKVTAKSCGNSNTSADSTQSMGFESLTFTVAKSGKYHLTATGSMKFQYALSASSNGLGQLAIAGYIAGLTFDYLDDNTNGTVFHATYTSGVSGEITRGTNSSTVSLTLTSYLNATLNATHTYQFGVGFFIIADVFVTPGSCTASASISMAKSGLRAVLTDVILT